MRDFRFWWALFVAFAVLSVLVVQRSYRRWRIARDVVSGMHLAGRKTYERQLRREGWRLVCMVLSLVAMTTLAFAAVLGAPPVVVFVLRMLAVGAVVAVLGLSLLR